MLTSLADDVVRQRREEEKSLTARGRAWKQRTSTEEEDEDKDELAFSADVNDEPEDVDRGGCCHGGRELRALRARERRRGACGRAIFAEGVTGAREAEEVLRGQFHCRSLLQCLLMCSLFSRSYEERPPAGRGGEPCFLSVEIGFPVLESGKHFFGKL